MSYKKRGKAIGYKFLSNKTEVNENSKFNTSEPKELLKKFTENKNKKKMCDQNALPKIVCVHLVAIQL